MSIRASIFNFLIRHTIKKQFKNVEDITVLREQMSGSIGPKLPAEVNVETVDAGGVDAEWVRWSESDGDAVLLYLHGGGYVFGGPDGHRDLAWRLAKEGNISVLVVDYRLAPEHPFPAAVDDATASYKWLLGNGYSAEKILVAGDSAGGGLSVALMLNLKNLGLPLPVAAALISPWTDLAATGESVAANAEADSMISPEALEKFADLYLGDRDPKAPLASPLYGDLTDLPPMMVVVGSIEVLLSDSERLVERINDAGGTASLSVWPGMPHVFPILAARVPEARQAVTEISDFLRREAYLSAA